MNEAIYRKSFTGTERHGYLYYGDGFDESNWLLIKVVDDGLCLTVFYKVES